MAKSLFDRKFGKDLINSVPQNPGVYQMIDAQGVTIYVGKAKNLRRRLQQYRNARRCKRHRKMRTILSESATVQFVRCENELEALLLENKLIQELRPKLNIAGAFSFLYPCLGIRRDGLNLHLCYSTTPDAFPMFSFYGAFRSRSATRDCYYALLNVLSMLGHKEPPARLSHYPKVRFSHICGFRQISQPWADLLRDFLTGASPDFLEKVFFALLERPSARRKAAEYQEHLDALKRFFKFEAKPLRKAVLRLESSYRFIRQEERDQLFLAFRHIGSTKANHASRSS